MPGIKTYRSVALISPPLTLEDRYGSDMKHFGAVTEPLGLAYIAGVLEKAGIGVSIIDAPALKFSVDEVIKQVGEGGYDLIGISLLTPSFGAVKALSDKLKATFPDKDIILGGPHCTALPERTMKEISSADLLCMGEGEETMKDLVMSSRVGSFESVKGICFRNGDNEVVRNEPRLYIRDLDTIPPPARHLLPMEKYHLTASRVAKGTYCPTIIVARGCPFGCSYCSHSFGRKIRFHSVERILLEIELLVKQHDIQQLNIEADTLTANKKFVKALCRELISRGYSKHLQWTCESRVDTVDGELLHLMKEAGCWQISYGIETGSQRLLNLINKGIRLEQIRETVFLTHQSGISVRGFFMLGLPGETIEESNETIDFAIDLNPRWAQFTITIPYPGTPMFDALQEEGEIRHFDWAEYNTWSGWKDKARIPFVAKGRTLEELVALQKKALRRFYLRPGMFLRFLFSIRGIDDFKKYATGLYVLIKSKFI